MVHVGIAAAFRRRLVTATIVGMLTLGGPAPRLHAPRTPPALVRVQDGPSPGAVAWRELIGPYRKTLN